MNNNLSQQSNSYLDLTLLHETSSELASSKYPIKKTTLKIQFVKHCQLNKINTFLITVIRKVGMFYSAFDQSTYFLLKSKENLLPNKKYLIYGKVNHKKIYLVYAGFVELINYKKILHELL
ncbi:hypothetical protein TUBRATIS_30310 [Tubulinosema ratisbonensis]|uniref:Uncharacterized protein n=1 Tax=Tubulinosema ratisbonensis TaxID=291195 RepID=A0A437AHA3_9MICR|nr:hypothetical protein TUBRATIS_30310 [Tubulinosema ratisbonensis]